MGWVDDDMGVVGTMTAEQIAEQRRLFAQMERRQEGRGSASTTAVDWVENYECDPDDPCCDAAQGSAAGRGRPLDRQSGARRSQASPGPSGGGATQGLASESHRSRSRHGRQPGGAQGSTGFAAPAAPRVRGRPPSADDDLGPDASGSDEDEHGQRFYRSSGQSWYGYIIFCPVP